VYNCRMSLVTESASVHIYALNFGRSTFNNIPEIWVWWQSQIILNLIYRF
jgi:hypothetical protein